MQYGNNGPLIILYKEYLILKLALVLTYVSNINLRYPRHILWIFLFQQFDCNENLSVIADGDRLQITVG